MITWNPADEKTATVNGTTVNYVAANATAASVAPKAGVGTWSKGGTKLSATVGVDANGQVTGMPDAAAFGYFKVDITYAANLSTYTVGAPTAMYLKAGESETFVTSGTGAWDAADVTETTSNTMVTVAKVSGEAGGTATIRVTLNAAANDDQAITIAGKW